MNTRVIVILGVVLLLLAGVAVFAQQGTPDSANATAKAVSPTATLLLASDMPIDQVELKQAQTTVRFHKDSDRWVLDLPSSDQTDQQRATSIVAKLDRLRPTGSYPAGDLASYGLAIPDMQINIRYQGGDTKTLLLGNQSATKAGYYAKLEGSDAIFLLDTVFATEAKGLISGPPIIPPTATATIVGPVLPSPAASGTPAPVATRAP